MSKKIKLLKAGVVAATLLALQGCVYLWVSKGMTDDGHVTELVFPDIQTKATLKEGIFINRANLRQMAPDMTKNQVYNLLGTRRIRQENSEKSSSAKKNDEF